MTADGGAICPSGMLMVCIAAKVSRFVLLVNSTSMCGTIITNEHNVFVLFVSPFVLSCLIFIFQELSVPVVCVTGAFTLTPLFAHSQRSVLNQLLSPADALPYNANINVNNVEVSYHYI